MIETECKECPIRNFCPAFNQDGCFYDSCPLFKAAQQTRAFLNADNIEKTKAR